MTTKLGAAEAAVLGALLLDPERLKENGIRLEYFADRRNLLIFDAFRTLDNPDETTLIHELERRGKLEEAGGLDHLLEVSGSVQTSVNLKEHVGILCAEWRERKAKLERMAAHGARMFIRHGEEASGAG